MSNDANTTRADGFKAEALRALNRSTIFGFGKSQKYEDAAEAFIKAGNAYKLANQWQSAGDVFLQAADAYGKAGDFSTEIPQSIVEAANCYKKINPLDAVNTFRKAIDLYNDAGRFGMSARYAKEMAEVFEADHNPDGALAAYQEAADLFNNDNKKTNALQCMQKVAEFAITKNDLALAGSIFEDVGREAMGSRLGTYSAKGHFFNCLLCHLALGDNVQVQQKLDTFKNVDFSFSSSRECEFIEKLLKASEEFSAEDFSQACSDYDRISPLDPSKTSLLLKAKKVITDQAGDGDVDLS